METKIQSIEVKTLPGANLPEYGHEDSSSFDLKVHSFKRVFKGAEELDMDNALKYSIEKQGKITLRPFERVQIGTGIFMELPKGVILQITTKPGLALSHGLVVFDSPRIIGFNHKEEICVTLYNSSQFLNRIYINDRIAKGTFINSDQVKFTLTE